MKKYLLTLILVLLVGCQNTSNNIQNNVVNDVNTQKQDVVNHTDTIHNEQKIDISLSENNLYAGQKAEISIELFSNGQPYAFNMEDVSLTASIGKINNSIYEAPVDSLNDSLTITHKPSGFVKTVSVSILSAPQLVVDIGNTLSCGDSISINPKVLIGDVSQNFSTNEFEYSSQTGKFSANMYLCPIYETKDNIVVYYKPLGLKKEIPVTINAKPILTIENIPESIEKNDKIDITAFFKKAQNKENINHSELNFSANIGSFSKNVYTATKIGTATLTITHVSTGQKIEKTVIVKDSLLLKVDIPSEIENYTTLPINPILMRSKQPVDAPYSEFSFRSERGTFNNNIYTAPAVTEMENSITDTITISHKKSSLEKKLPLKINHSKFRTITTARFSMPIPSSWNVINEQMGFIATDYSGPYQPGKSNGAEIKALALSGFNFLEPQTVMVLFQQQGGVGKNMEKVGEDEVNIAGLKVTRILFESNNIPLKKSWWMIFKHERVMYLITISGDEYFFQGKNSDANQIINNFKFIPLGKSPESLVMSKKDQVVDEDYFSLSIPETWKVGNIFQVFFASSDISYQGEKVGLFVFAHRSREIQSMDLSLILLLFRQEIVKDPTMKISDEKELSLSGIPAKMVVFSGGQDITNKMWLIAIKHDYTGYVMVVNGPQKIWDENPDFAEKIKDSFKPKN